MRKMLILLVVLTFWLLAKIFSGYQVEAQYAPNGQGFPLASPLKITSPLNITYNTNLLTLNVTFKLLLPPNSATLVYSLDDKENVTISLKAVWEPIEGIVTYPNGTTTKATSIFSPYVIWGFAALPELTQGQHKITVYAKYQANNIIGLDKRTVYFTIISKNGTENHDATATSPSPSSNSSLNPNVPPEMQSEQTLKARLTPSQPVSIYVTTALLTVGIIAAITFTSSRMKTRKRWSTNF